DVGLVDRSAVRRGALDVAERGATGDVGQEAVEGVADAAATGAQPAVLGRAAGGAAGAADSAAGRRSVDPAGVDVAFQAEDEVAGLPVVAEGAAEQIFLGVEADVAGDRVVPVAMATGVAAVKAQVEAGPAEHGRRDIDGRLVRGTGQVGGERGRSPGSSQQASEPEQSETFHRLPPVGCFGRKQLTLVADAICCGMIRTVTFTTHIYSITAPNQLPSVAEPTRTKKEHRLWLRQQRFHRR